MQLWPWLTCVVLCIPLTACVTETTVTAADRQHQPNRNMTEAARTRVALGINYLQVGDKSQAKYNLDKALQMAPQLAELHNALAYYYQQVQDHDAVVESYRQAMALEPDNADSYNNFGAYLCQQGQYQQAEQLLLEAIERPGYFRVADSYENLALCALEQNDFSKTRHYLNLSLTHNATRPSAQFNSAALYYATKQLELAAQTLELMQRASQLSAPVLLLSYQVAQELQHWPAMQEAEQQLLSLYPQSREALLLSQQQLTKSEFSALRQRYLASTEADATDSATQPRIKIVRKKAAVEASKKAARQHQVKANESLAGIAQQYGVTMSDLISWNALRPGESLQEGQWLNLNEPASTKQNTLAQRHLVTPGETLSQISLRYNIKLAHLLQWNNLTEQSPLRAGQFIYLKDPAYLDYDN
ncbi:type IV pilus biogenesis/stability protein PilW [Rheinheimera sp.]|uniref:type IV pilus biogenesis/stability protein PilW n=1 Tax=Rheinheimera sp. TaxID=1869214 RepID=UPI003AF6FCC7